MYVQNLYLQSTQNQEERECHTQTQRWYQNVT